MLHINELTYRIEGRTLLDRATAAIPARHRVGLVGRNGSGKTTLLRLIAGELAPDGGSIRLARDVRVGTVAQEAPAGDASVLAFVLAGDRERNSLLAEARTAEDPARIADIHERLATLGAHTAPARAARILAGLGFNEAAQARPCAAFSGGWRRRVALAAALFAEPDLLLLDEPTNDLDLEGALWLEAYLRDYPSTLLIVSHDRDLLNRSVTSILYLSEAKLTLFAGGYDRFEETRRAKQRLDLKLKKKQDDARRRIQTFVDRFRAKASKARQVQSRLKTLARMEPIAAEVEGRVRPFHIPNPEPIASPLIRLEGAATGYGSERVLSALDLSLGVGDRLALLGVNGNGKSTFAKLLAGRLPVLAGKRIAAPKLRIGYFAQAELEELSPLKTPYDHIVERMPDAAEARRRAKLGQLGFTVATADTKAERLSGGEKARLLLALAVFEDPHLLILDEPTNHLDIDAREALVQALLDYTGALLVISHDRHLIEACADRLLIARNGTVASYAGDVASYAAECLAEPNTVLRSKRRGERAASPSEIRRQAAGSRAALAPLRQRIAAAEREMQRIAGALAALDAALADPALYHQDQARAGELARERGRLEVALERAEALWMAASEAHEEATGEAKGAAAPNGEAS